MFSLMPLFGFIFECYFPWSYTSFLEEEELCIDSERSVCPWGTINIMKWILTFFVGGGDVYFQWLAILRVPV